MLSSDFLSAAIGVAISLVFKYVPSVKAWYYSEKVKPMRGLLMVFFALFVATFVYTLGCYGILELSCTDNSLKEAIRSFGYVLMSNQLAYILSPTLDKIQA